MSIINITCIIQICLIPASAHGTNPASAIMAGLKVVEIPMNKEGEVTKDSFKQKVREWEGDEIGLGLLSEFYYIHVHVLYSRKYCKNHQLAVIHVFGYTVMYSAHYNVYVHVGLR